MFVGYFRPDKQGERHPYHGHTESGGNLSTASQGVTVYAGTTAAPVTLGAPLVLGAGRPWPSSS